MHDALQVDAILGLTLRRLTALEERKLDEEHTDLLQRAAHLDAVLADDAQIMGLIKQECLELKAAHAVPRKTEIVLEASDKPLVVEDVVANQRYALFLIAQTGDALLDHAIRQHAPGMSLLSLQPSLLLLCNYALTVLLSVPGQW